MKENTFEHFVDAVNLYVEQQLGTSPKDMPDLIRMDDYYYEGMRPVEFAAAVKECGDEIINSALE